MFDFIFLCILAIFVAFVLRLITTFIAKDREKAWRWIATTGTTVGFSAAFGAPVLFTEPEILMGIAVVVVVVFWTLVGSVFGAALATRFVQRWPKPH